MKKLILSSHWVFILLMLGCAHQGLQLDNMDYPISRIKFAVSKSLPIGKRSETENGREFFSKYFIVSKGKFIPAKSFRKRKHVHISILGDRRPYKINVTVIFQVRVKGDGISESYKTVGEDRPFAKVILRRIRKILSKRRDEGDIIDDFRIF